MPLPRPLHVGFTGRRDGLRGPQLRAVADLIDALAPDVLHMGDCVGADVVAARLARSRGCRIVAHPPDQDGLRAFFDADEVRAPDAYLARDRAIVTASAILLAAPASAWRRPHSGTWYTAGYAVRCGVPVCWAWPDGRSNCPPMRRDAKVNP